MSQMGVDYLRVTHPFASDSEEPLDLHVLGTPPAFVLSQDQTLRNIYFGLFDSLDSIQIILTLVVILPVFKEQFCFCNFDRLQNYELSN